MRGSVYYQSAELTKVIFFEGAKKHNRINPNHIHYNCVEVLIYFTILKI